MSREGGGLLALGIILAILGASRLFATIDKVFAIVYRTSQRSFLRRLLVSLGMVVIFIVLFSIIIAASLIPSFIPGDLPYGTVRAAVYFAGIMGSLFIAFTLFELIYWLVPNRKMPLRVTWCGALFAACAIEIIILVFPQYVQTNMDSYTGKLFIENIYKINCFILSCRFGWFCSYFYRAIVFYLSNIDMWCSNQCILFRRLRSIQVWNSNIFKSSISG